MNILLARLIKFTLLLTPLLCFGVSPKIAPDLVGVPPQTTVTVIIRFSSPLDSAGKQKLKNQGGMLKAELSLIHAAAYTLPAAALNGIANDPQVIYISPDRSLGATLDYASPTVGAQIALQYGWNGTGVGVAVIDSGITSSRDLNDPANPKPNVSRIVYSQSFVGQAPTGQDHYGHGTHVAGILAGNGSASTGPNYYRTFGGMARNANLINLQVLDGNGMGTDSAVINAINRAIELKTTYNIRVINLSLGRPVYESYSKDPLCQAVEKAWKAGIVVVVAAGNEGRNRSQGTDGYATITSPANDPLVITVGAMKHMGTSWRADDLIASYSSKGPTLIDHVVKPDLVAPGNRIVSLASSNWPDRHR